MSFSLPAVFFFLKSSLFSKENKTEGSEVLGLQTVTLQAEFGESGFHSGDPLLAVHDLCRESLLEGEKLLKTSGNQGLTPGWGSCPPEMFTSTFLLPV